MTENGIAQGSRKTVRATSFLTALLAGLLVVNLFVVGVVWQSLYQSRIQYEEQAAVAAGSLSHVLAHELGGTINSIDLALSAVMDEYVRQRDAGGVAGAALNRYIARMKARLPVLDALRIADSRGTVVYGSDVAPGSQTNIADRPHFVRLRDEANAGLVISRLQRSRVNGKWVVVFARRIEGPAGAFGGMAFGTISLDDLTTSFSRVDTGRNGSVSLRDTEMRILARHPVPQEPTQVIGERLDVPPLQDVIREGRDAGAYITDRTVDRVERRFSVRRIDKLPLYIVVGRSTRESLASWRDQMRRSLVLAALFLMTTLASSWQIYRNWLRREAATADLARAEEQVRRLNAELEQRVADRTAQLEAANKELEEFSYSLSHDLRSPLRAIDGFSKIVLEEHETQLDEEGKRQLRVVRDNSRRMGRLIDDILQFLRMGKRRMECRSVDMTRLAQAVFDELQVAMPLRRLRLEIGDLPRAWGDVEMIRMVVANLLSNAVKFSPSDTEATIEVGATAGEKENTYFVRDRGVGFDMRFADKLFRVFERVHPTGQYEGSAIGLAIVKRIVGRHGGRVWAEGKVDEGATFHFSLPRADGQPGGE